MRFFRFVLRVYSSLSVAHDSKLRIRQISKRGTEREIGLKKLYVVPLGFGMAVGRVREIHSSFSPTNIEAQRIVDGPFAKQD